MSHLITDDHQKLDMFISVLKRGINISSFWWSSVIKWLIM